MMKLIMIVTKRKIK